MTTENPSELQPTGLLPQDLVKDSYSQAFGPANPRLDLMPTMKCHECGEVINVKVLKPGEYWAELVDFTARNGWVYFHTSCKPVPADRFVNGESVKQAEPEIALVKPAIPKPIKPAKTSVAGITKNRGQGK